MPYTSLSVLDVFGAREPGSDEDVELVLTEAYRILKRGGVLCLSGLTYGQVLRGALLRFSHPPPSTIPHQNVTTTDDSKLPVAVTALETPFTTPQLGPLLALLDQLLAPDPMTLSYTSCKDEM